MNLNATLVGPILFLIAIVVAYLNCRFYTNPGKKVVVFIGTFFLSAAFFPFAIALYLINRYRLKDYSEMAEALKSQESKSQ
ncbi:hypothetical protein [Planctobacterium marinum]|uniref:Uncharacterized protein n=1 Tax=Planctobacterium marinum TaxID=1631968 RepID=A0AA48KSK3_9ALTE|nr:hypothetical protein MACH26_27530 [Planctobacterium marinum]